MKCAAVRPDNVRARVVHIIAKRGWVTEWVSRRVTAGCFRIPQWPVNHSRFSKRPRKACVTSWRTTPPALLFALRNRRLQVRLLQAAF